MNQDYLSIKEFAKRVEQTPQAIYKQLDNKLKDYFKVIDGKKMIHKSAILAVYNVKSSDSVEQQLINLLKEELKQKDKQIEELQRLLSQQQELQMVQLKNIPLLVTSDPEQEDLKEPEPEVKKQDIKSKKSRWKFWRSNK